MPSERFLKLDKEKQERIRRAAIKELSRVPFEEASINRIIKEADISRGSFYTYFKDKMDIVRYLMSDYETRFREALVGYLDREKGDFFKMADRLYRDIIAWGKSPEFKIIENVFPDVGMLSKVLGAEDRKKSVYSHERFLAFCHALYEHTDCSHIGIPEEDFGVFAEMVLTPTVRDAMHTCIGFKDAKKIRRAYDMQMEIIREGVSGLSDKNRNRTGKGTKRQ